MQCVHVCERAFDVFLYRICRPWTCCPVSGAATFLEHCARAACGVSCVVAEFCYNCMSLDCGPYLKLGLQKGSRRQGFGVRRWSRPRFCIGD